MTLQKSSYSIANYFKFAFAISRPLLDSEFLALDSRFQMLDSDSLLVEIGFRIPIVTGFQIPAAEFRIPKPRILDSTSKNVLDTLDSGIQIILQITMSLVSSERAIDG